MIGTEERKLKVVATLDKVFSITDVWVIILNYFSVYFRLIVALWYSEKTISGRLRHVDFKSICTCMRMRSVHCCILSKTKTSNLFVDVFENSGFVIAIWFIGFQKDIFSQLISSSEESL